MANLFYFGIMGLIIYKSSAGSGKTFTLVSRFLIKVIERPWLFRRILAITFTNKATEELKTRIIRELDTLAHGADSRYLVLLRNQIPRLSEEEIRQNALLVLSKILHDYSSFSVSTIDSYFQSLARILARELMLPIRYEIELDTEAICRNITSALLDEAGKNEFITRWLEELLLNRIENGKSWNISGELEKMTRQLLSSDEARDYAGTANTDQLLELINWMINKKSTVEGRMRTIGKNAIQAMDEHSVDISSFYQKKSGPAGYLLKIAHHKSSSKEYQKINSYTTKALDDPMGFLSKQEQKNTTLIHLVETTLHTLLVEAVQYYQQEERIYTTVIEALKLVYQSGITGALDTKLKEYREQHQLFHLSDTTRMLSKAVQEQDAPFIYEKSGNTFLHLFIDEFQDTATEQWNILKPLVLNSLGNGNDVYIVGDAKQSIYRWRGGNMQLIVDGVRKDLSHTGFKPTEEILDTNWRSKINIVHFNNTFFPAAAILAAEKCLIPNHPLFKAYENAQVFQKHKSSGAEGGYVEIRSFDSDKKKDETIPEEEKQHWKQRALKQMSVEIARQLELGYQPGDIVILVRTNGHENEIADHLFKEGKYPFISSNSLLIANQPQVRFILNCFRLLLNPNLALLHAEINQFIDSTQVLTDIPYRKDQLLKNRQSWAYLNILNKKETLSPLPLQFVFLYLLDAGALAKTDPFIQKLSELIDDFANSSGNSIAGFIQWWDEHVDTRKWSVELPDGGNALRIITIHRSKGLEFPVVFMPFLDWSLIPSQFGIMWANAKHEQFNSIGKLPVYTVKALETSYFSEDYLQETLETSIDNLNLLYVAFTRPEEKLFVYMPSAAKENDAGAFITDTIENTGELNENVNAEGIFSLGENSTSTSTHQRQEHGELFKPASFHAFDLPAPETPSIALPPLQLAFTSEETIFGNLVHESISSIQQAGEIRRAVNSILSKDKNRAFHKQRTDLEKTVTEIWNLLEERKWTAEYWEVENETELCDEKNQLHRPDKVLMKGDSGIVIDFKTGKQDKQHHHQVQEYCRLLQQTGIKQVEGYLIYTIEKEIVKVDLDDTNVTGQTTLFN